VYNKLEPQPFLLFDCHKYGELGSNETFSAIESWETSAVPQRLFADVIHDAIWLMNIHEQKYP
jgi:hypothetical protein